MDTVVVMPRYVEATITIRQSLSYESVPEIRSLDEMGHRRYGSSQIDMRLNGNTSQAFCPWNFEAGPLDLMDVRPVPLRAMRNRAVMEGPIEDARYRSR